MAGKTATPSKVITDALVKRVMKLRAKGWTWNEIVDEGIVTVGQVTPIRAAMRKLDPTSVINSGPRKAKKASGKKTARKKTAAKRSR